MSVRAVILQPPLDTIPTTHLQVNLAKRLPIHTSDGSESLISPNPTLFRIDIL